jgi:hypothetical protein
MIVPLTAGSSGLDSNTSLLLLVHEVGGCGTVVHFADFMYLASKLQYALGSCGFTGVDVGKYADIAVTIQVSHVGFQLIK